MSVRDPADADRETTMTKTLTRLLDATGRYAAILLAAMLLFILEPLLATERQVPWGLSVVTFFVLMGSLRAVWAKHALFYVVGFLGVGLIALETTEALLGSRWAVAADVFGIAFLATTGTGILLDIFTRDEITADTVFGASAVYLLIGLLFGRVFLLIAHVDPNAFAVSDALAEELAVEGFRGSGILHYFSLITLTTVGYGDVSPVAPLARNLAAIEAVIAQLFVAAVIARLVALYTTRQTEKE